MTLTTALAVAVGVFGLGCLLLLGFLSISLYYNWKFARIIFAVEDSVEECLDILDDQFNELSVISEKEIFFDSPEVRQAVASISSARSAVLYVANALASIDSNAVEDPDTDEEG